MKIFFTIFVYMYCEDFILLSLRVFPFISSEESDGDFVPDETSDENNDTTDQEQDQQDTDTENEGVRDRSCERDAEWNNGVGKGRGRGRGCGRGRGRGRGSGRGIGRARGRGRARGDVARGVGRVRGGAGQGGATPNKGYDDIDNGNQLPPFSPTRQPGIHMNVRVIRGNFTKAIDFFQLFFTHHLLTEICQHTNSYGWMNIEKKPYYADADGAWNEIAVEELKKLIALILYMGIVKVSSFDRYWSTKTLYHGLWARKIMARDRFKALMAMLHVVDPYTEEERDKLRKVRGFLDCIATKCKELYQPFSNLSIDERMVKSRHRSGIRQYIKNKPTKWGIKLWVLADSANGYTCDFNVYIGKNTEQPPSQNGLGYDVVTRLIQPYTKQGYHLYFDNFYTSVKLVKDLFGKLTPSCGTVAENRKGFPANMKNGKIWGRKAERGSMRWDKDGCCVAQQWKDNKVVTMLTSVDKAHEFGTVSRNVKVNNSWVKMDVKQPKSINSYNRFMNGVDRSDQLLAKNNTLRKCMRWWKTLFFHLIDIAVVNSFILFQLYRTEHSDVDELHRPSQYSVLEFREELIRQLAGLDDYGAPPVFQPPKKQVELSEFETVHLPRFSESKRNCKVCYAADKSVLKVVTYCSAPQCNVFLHCTKDKDCFAIWHTAEYHNN